MDTLDHISDIVGNHFTGTTLSLNFTTHGVVDFSAVNRRTSSERLKAINTASYIVAP